MPPIGRPEQPPSKLQLHIYLIGYLVNILRFSHTRLRTPTRSLVLDRLIRDSDLARGIHVLLC